MLMSIVIAIVPLVFGTSCWNIWVIERSKKSSEQQQIAHVQDQQISESLASSFTTPDPPLLPETPMQATQSASVDILDSALTRDQHSFKIKCSHIAAPPGRVFDREELLSRIHGCL